MIKLIIKKIINNSKIQGVFFTNIKSFINKLARHGTTGISGFFSAYGSFGIVDGMDYDMYKITETDSGFSFENDSFYADCNLEFYENSVISRKDVFTAKTDLVLNRYTSRFCLEGGDYEVYTQSSCWLTESKGGWQELVTGIEVSNMGIRTTDGATPMAVVRNKGNGKILVIHLMPNAMWKIKISKLPICGQNMGVLIETGINDYGLKMTVKKGEKIEMPRLFVFEAESPLDFDAWKLHTVYNRLYPRKNLPVLYNTWLNTFDTINVDDIINQAKAAAELGVEQFLIDAGWFGTTENWNAEIGNWTENQKGGYKGRVRELSDYVRSLGMKFGMWLEPERVLKNTEAYNTHPEYYKNGSNGVAFLDFANEEARKYITDITLGLIEKYEVKFMKFDFNASLAYDETNCAFYHYFKGAKQYISDIKDKYPDIYITNCASGGTRMDLENGMIYDSIWLSDNQSPIYAFRIFKDTALRIPPCHLEKWDVRRFFDGFPKYGARELVRLPISCNGGTWENVCNVTREYTHNFMTGGPIGFSTDIAGYPQDEKEILKKHVEQFKLDRDFYKTANLRILHDTDNLTVIQYNDVDFERVIIQTFSNVLNQDCVTIYPKLDKNKKYSMNNTTLCGREISENGICVQLADINSVTIELKKI